MLMTCDCFQTTADVDKLFVEYHKLLCAAHPAATDRCGHGTVTLDYLYNNFHYSIQNFIARSWAANVMCAWPQFSHRDDVR